MSKQFRTSTVEKYLDFLHYLRLQLQQNDPDFKISYATRTWKINTNALAALQKLGNLSKQGRGKYEWVGGRPDEDLARAVLTEVFIEPQRQALLPGLSASTPTGAEINDLKKRISELETLVLQIMEKVA